MISCALVGFGYWGPNIARSLSQIREFSLTTIVDINKTNLAKAKQLYPQIQTRQNYHSLFKNSDITAVIIATPANTHFELASEAIRKNKHVLIEKPLSTTLAQAQKLIRLSRNSSKVIMVGHTFEFNPAILKIKEFIKTNQLGEIYYIYTTRVNLGQIRGDVNALWNLAPHDISILNFLLGSQPEKVSATGISILQKDIEDVAFVLAKYPHNILAQIHVSWLDPAKIRNMTIVGSKKMLVFDDLDNEMPLKIYDKRVKMAEIAKGQSFEYKIRLHSGDIYAPQAAGSEPLVAELKHFFDCIVKNQKPKTDVENGARVVRVLTACQKSLKNGGKWIRI